MLKNDLPSQQLLFYQWCYVH